MQINRYWLKVNGVDRMMIVDLEKDTLATALRRLGLTGVKVGCGTGMCGSCSVILNGKVIRSCTRKLKAVPEYSEITTIEGIGTPQHLHPLQQAWIFCGAVQCGFCTPGFIVSAYQLLLENPSPTREEVRAWFKKHRNICRCTGYKQIVDAVLEAAAVMRGEKTMDDITYKMPEDGEFYGTALPRPDALAKVTGLCDYGDDIALKMPDETVYIAIVQPRKAFHAKVLSIDFSEAEKMPGFIKAITADDVKGTNNLGMPARHPRDKQKFLNAPVLCGETIYRYGDVVAMVAADSPEHARAAAAKVVVELEQLPEYHNYVEAVAPGAMDIHPGDANQFIVQPVFKGDFENIDEIIDDSAYSITSSFSTSREPHMSIEGDVMQAYVDADGLLTIHCKAQAVYLVKFAISQAIGLPPDKIRVVLNPTGGTFGWGMGLNGFALAAVASLALDGRPISLSLSWEEFQHFSGKRAASYSNATMACDENGKITAFKYDFGVDGGAYPMVLTSILQRFALFNGFHYAIPNITGLVRGATTNHAFCTTYRGFGSPQAYSCGEAIVDMLARKVGIDPLEFRKINVAHNGDLMTTNYPYFEISSPELLERIEPFYKEAKARAEAESTPEKRRGVGLALGGYNCTTGGGDMAGARLELRPDGKVEVYNTWEEMGQGADAGNQLVVAQALKDMGITPDQVIIRTNDTKFCPDSGPAAGSRSHMMNSHVVVLAANDMMKALKKDDGTFRTYDECVAEGIDTAYEGTWINGAHIDGLVELDPNDGNGSPIPTYMYAIYLAEVEVDTATGKVKVLSMKAICDIGRVGNLNSVLGQGFGGISHSIGFALSEDYSDVKKHGNMIGAGIPDCEMIPDDIEIMFCNNERSNAEFGSSGCSEMFQSSDHVAVLNAIDDACGVRIHEIPATPDKVKAGLDAIAAGEPCPEPEEYYMGSEFWDEVEEIVENPVALMGSPMLQM